MTHPKPQTTKPMRGEGRVATQILTYRYRVKKPYGLVKMSKDVNFVWNYCNDAQKHALKWGKRWLSYFDLSTLTSGGCREINVAADSISSIAKCYTKSRKQHNRPYLRYRGHKSLGWVPFRGPQIKFKNGDFKFNGKVYKVWLSRPLPDDAVIKDGGSFSQDSQGHWYLNVVFETSRKQSHQTGKFIGIDLGLKDLATLSNGEKIEAPRLYRASEVKLGRAQRANKKHRIKKIHAKIANQRKDYLHKASAGIAKRFGFIAVGNVSSSKLAKTKMAKSVLDAGWSDFRNMLAYKSIRNGGKYTEVNEAYSSQTCSVCENICGPKGRKGLNVREWVCEQCGSVHDRDQNAARNILRNAHVTPVAGAA